MTDHSDKPPVERAIEIAVYAPIGFAMFAKDMLPPLIDQFVARGRARVTELQSHVENQIGQARIMGQFAVAEGSRQVRDGLGQRLHDARARGERLAETTGLLHRDEDGPEEPTARTEAAPAGPSAAAPSGAPAGNGTSSPPEANGRRGDSSNLPIPDYDELSASQVVARLSGLDPSDLEAVRAYEQAERQRKTILTKIDQLTS